MQIVGILIFVTLLRYKPGYRFCINRKGKSGQHRATHRLIAGSEIKTQGDSATENNLQIPFPLVERARVREG